MSVSPVTSEDENYSGTDSSGEQGSDESDYAVVMMTPTNMEHSQAAVTNMEQAAVMSSNKVYMCLDCMKFCCMFTYMYKH